MTTDSKWKSFMSKNTGAQNNTPKNYRLIETAGYGFNAATTNIVKQSLRQANAKK